VALANKETLVTGGSLVKKAIYKKNQLFPLDSEHSAIYQLLVGQNKTYLKRIILTASGGPLWEVNRNILSSATPKQALTHPRWSMGTKISIDSATMMNKGLEVIETMWLFDIDLGNISIIIHPQSIVHSLIELNDGVILAHLGPVDMHLPIAYALNHPKRVPLPFQPLDLTKEPLTFFPPDLEKFPCLGLALRAAKIGGSMPVVLNATNEIAVEAFLEKKIKITDIAVLVETNMEAHIPIKEMDLETIFSVDKWARVQTHKELQKLI
jgi:1-deoxy-D-xylulose-5-phosphate reductoisomerase